MSLFNFRSLLKRVLTVRSTCGRRRPPRSRAALRLEHLEDRSVPAVTDLTSHMSFSTIQAAVNAANPYDVIVADAGTYNEHVTINKSLTLEGSQYGVDARTRSGTESIVDGGGFAPFYVTANDVTIDGFTIQGASSGSAFPGGFGVEMASGISGTHITNDIIQNNIAGIALANLSGSDQAVIQFDLFQNNTLPGSASGTDIYADQYTAGAAGVNNVLIDSNTFTNSSFVENAWALGMSNTGTTPFSNITFSNNDVTNHGRGVYFYATTNSTVTGNTITGASHYAIGLFGSNGSPANSGFTIANNTLAANGAGLVFENDTSAFAYSGTLTVADLVGANVSATEGSEFTGVVATFTDPTGTQTAGDYSATINWGDGTTSAGTITGPAATFSVQGSHTYAEQGTYALSVSIAGPEPSTTNTSVALGIGSSVVLSPTEAPGAWYPDRYAPAGFTSGATGGGRVGVLDQFISANDQDGSRPSGYNTGFYDFQGRTYDLAAGTSYLAVDLYVPASWSSLTQKDPSGSPASWGSLASLWATGVDASGNITTYPIIGFNNQANAGAGGFRVYTDANGWTDVAGFSGAGQWYQIGFAVRAGQTDYFVNGQMVYADTSATGTTALKTVMLEGYNGGNDYHIYWDNLRNTSATIADVAPTATLGNNGPVAEGRPATVTFSGVYDPSALDTAAGFHYSFALSESSLASNYAAAGTATSAQFTWPDNGSHTVWGRVFAKDGGYTDYSTTILVAKPVVSAGPNQTINAGATLSRLGSFTDPGATSWTATVNYGDGSGVHRLALKPDKTFSLSHVYARKGDYTVTVTVTDNDGGVGSATFEVTVRPAIPKAKSLGPRFGRVG